MDSSLGAVVSKIPSQSLQSPPNVLTGKKNTPRKPIVLTKGFTDSVEQDFTSSSLQLCGVKELSPFEL